MKIEDLQKAADHLQELRKLEEFAERADNAGFFEITFAANSTNRYPMTLIVDDDAAAYQTLARDLRLALAAHFMRLANRQHEALTALGVAI